MAISWQLAVPGFDRKGCDKVTRVVDELIKDDGLAVCDLVKVETLYDLILDKKTWGF